MGRPFLSVMPMVEPYSRATRTAIFYAFEDDCHATGSGKIFDMFPGSASRRGSPINTAHQQPPFNAPNHGSD
jgi:hypothetical protein